MEDIKQQFEANFLDSDKIDDCGGTTFTVSGALDIAEYFYALAVKNEREKILDTLKKWNCHQIGCDWNRNRAYGNKVCDMNCKNVLEVINNYYE